MTKAIASETQLAIDPAIVPWSLRGSYICLATRSGDGGVLTPGKDVYLISHNYGWGLPLFAIRPQITKTQGAPCGFHTSSSPVEFSASPSRMVWTAGDETVAEATFLNERTIRFRGTAPLSFDTQGNLNIEHWRCWLFQVPAETPESPPTAEFTSTPNTAFRFVAVRGSLDLVNDAPFDPFFKDNRRRVTVSCLPGSKDWELQIVERETETGIESLPLSTTANSFQDSASIMEQKFDQYCGEMCVWGKDRMTMADKMACYVMWTSTVRAAGFFRNEAVLMSKLWMNRVWSWDNCFNGLAMIGSGFDLALNQIMLPFDYITEEGRLPDSVTRSEILYDYTKPPIYGWTFFKLLHLLDPASTEQQPIFHSLPRPALVKIYRQVGHFTTFWYTARRTAFSELPYYSHGNDSGWDNATCYDRQTVCVSPDLAALLVVQCDFLHKLGNFLDEPSADKWGAKRQSTRTALLSELWSESDGQFLFKDALDGSRWTSTSLLKFITLTAALHLPVEIIDRMTGNLAPHVTEWGLATEEPSSPLYEADGYWRGPIWAPPTILIESGLRAAGKTGMADMIVDRYIHLCEKSGYAENYDALQGTGNRDLSYTWAASTYLVFRRELEERGAKSGMVNGHH